MMKPTVGKCNTAVHERGSKKFFKKSEAVSTRMIRQHQQIWQSGIIIRRHLYNTNTISSVGIFRKVFA